MYYDSDMHYDSYSDMREMYAERIREWEKQNNYNIVCSVPEGDSCIVSVCVPATNWWKPG